MISKQLDCVLRNVFFLLFLVSFANDCTYVTGSANPFVPTSSRPNPRHNIVVHSTTTTKQPLVVLLQRKKEHLQSLYQPPYLPSPETVKPKVID